MSDTSSESRDGSLVRHGWIFNALWLIYTVLGLLITDAVWPDQYWGIGLGLGAGIGGIAVFMTAWTAGWWLDDG